MAVSSGQKGVFLTIFLKAKLKLSFLSLFREIFPIKSKTIFIRIPHKISALTDKQFSSYGRFKQPKRAIFGRFLGVKLKLSFLRLFEEFFPSSPRTIFLVSHAKFQP
jgi:hypothetical protein